MELALNTLTKTYGKKKAVQNVTANLTPGVYGLLGPNGAGKTTLLNMMCGLLRPDSGSVSFDGKDIVPFGEQYRSTLGFLPQSFGYYRNYTVRRFLAYIAYLKGIEKRAAETRTMAVLERLSLSDAIDSKLSRLSGGMRQRVGIAQAILNEPEILILDEPTVGLDPEERIRFRNLIAEMVQDKIIILSTHIVSDVAHTANKLLVMNEGSIIFSGSPAGFAEKAAGKVWEVIADSAQAEQLALRHKVSKLFHTSQGVNLRLLSDNCPFEGARAVSPDLEDAYLLYTGQKGEAEHEV